MAVWSHRRSALVIARKDLSAPDSLVDLRAGGRYLAFRGLLFLAMLCILVASISIEVVDGKGRCWPIYLTHQGALIETIYLGLAFSTTAKAYYYRDVEGTKDAPERTPWYCRAA